MKVIVLTDEQYEERFADAVAEPGAVDMMIDRPEGEYSILYQNDSKSMMLRHGNLGKGKAFGKFNFGGNVHLPTYQGDITPDDQRETFYEVACKLKKAYPEKLRHINPDRIMFAIDYEWTPSKSTHNSNWKMNLVKINTGVQSILDYDFIFYIHWYYIKPMTAKKVYALLMAYFLQIDPEKKTVRKLFVDDQNQVTVTFSKDVFKVDYDMERDIIRQPLRDDEWKDSGDDFNLIAQYHEQLALQAEQANEEDEAPEFENNLDGDE